MVKEDTVALASPVRSRDVAHDSTEAEALAEALGQVIGAKRYDAWFHRGVRFDLSDPKTLLVEAGSSLQRDCLRKHFKADLREACLRAGLGKRQVDFSVGECGGETEGNESPLSVEPAPLPSPSPAAAEGRLGLSGIIQGESNREAVALAGMIASGGVTASPVVLWGPSGSGKTHLLKGIRDEVRRHRRRTRVVYLTAEDFTSGFVEAVYGRSLSSFRGKHRGVDLLLIDDAQFLLGKQKTLEELQYTLDALANQGATVVLASDRSPAELRRMSGELLARLGAGVVVEVASPDFAAKRRLVEHFASERGLPLEPEASKLIAGGVIGGAWELRGVVNKLHLTWQLLKESVGDGLIQRTIEDMNRVSTPSVRIKDIQDAVCQVFGVEAAVIKSSRRTKSATEPRMLAMWLARKYTQSAWSEIGDHFGRRSHSTVISACRRVDDLMDRHASVRVTGGPCQMQEALRLVEAQLRTA